MASLQHHNVTQVLHADHGAQIWGICNCRTPAIAVLHSYTVFNSEAALMLAVQTSTILGLHHELFRASVMQVCQKALCSAPHSGLTSTHLQLMMAQLLEIMQIPRP